MVRVIAVRPIEPHRLHVRFSDDVEGVVDLSGELVGPVFERLRDHAEFARVFVDEFGAVCWPSGADLDPLALHRRIVGQTQIAI
jgi:hypothetical protein